MMIVKEIANLFDAVKNTVSVLRFLRGG